MLHFFNPESRILLQQLQHLSVEEPIVGITLFQHALDIHESLRLFVQISLQYFFHPTNSYNHATVTPP